MNELNVQNTTTQNHGPAISTSAEFQLYDSQMEIPARRGFRVVKCLFQENKKTGKKLRESAFVYIPEDHISEDAIRNNLDELIPFIIDFLQDKENSMIKERYKSGCDNVFYDALSIQNIIDQLEIDSIGSRLNSEIINSWFAEEVEYFLLNAFAERVDVNLESEKSEDLARIEKVLLIVESYKKKFLSLASGKTSLIDSDIENLKKVIISACSPESRIGKRLVARLNGIAEKKVEMLEDF